MHWLIETDSRLPGSRRFSPGPPRATRSSSAPADTRVVHARGPYGGWIVQVSAVDQHAGLQLCAESRKIGTSELLPLGDHDERVGADAGRFGAVAECDAGQAIGQCGARRGVCLGIVGPYVRTVGNCVADQDQARRLTHVISVWFEG